MTMNRAPPAAAMATFLCPDKALEALLNTFLDPVLRNLPPFGCPKPSFEAAVSKQMEAIGWLYNRYLCRDFPNLINLDWEELCRRASKGRSKLLRYITTAKEGIPCSLTLTEQRVKNACETAKFVVNIHNNMQNFPVTKICVCLLNSRLDKCVFALGASTMGVWTFIEKEKCVQYTEGDQITDSEEDFAFKAVQDYTGIRTNALKIGDSFLVGDDMNQAGCSTKLYIMLCNGTFDLSPTIKLKSIVWRPLSETLSKVNGPLIELTDDSAVRSTSAVHYFRLRPFCSFIKDWLTSHQEREQKIGYSGMNADEKLGSCKPEGFEQAVTFPCKPITVMVSEFEMKQDTCNGKQTAKKEDSKSSSTCLHSQNQRLPMDSLQYEMKSSMDVDILTLHQQANPAQNVNLNDIIVPPDTFICRHPLPISNHMLPDDMTSHNDACIHAEIATMSVTPAGNIEEHQIHKDTDDLPRNCAPLRNKVSKCAPETETAKKQSSPLKFGVNKGNICDCNQEHDGKPKQVKLENANVSLHVHSPKSSTRAMKRFEDHCMDKETSAFSLNKALHNVWKKRKAMCKELKNLHSQVDRLHEKIARCDSNLATLIGGGRNGLQLAIQICKVEFDKQMSSSDDCLDQEGHEEAPLSTEVISNKEQKDSKKRPFHMLKNTTECS